MGMPNIYAVGTFVLSSFISYYSIPIIILIARMKHLVDTPDERKLHKKVIPTLGGIALYAAIAISYSLFAGIETVQSMVHFTGALAILFFVGLKDDILVISPYKKLAGQFLAAGIVMINGLYITNLGGVLGIEDIPFWLSVPLTLFTFIVVINAYNLIDGVDGLAGGIGVIASSAFGFWFLADGYTGTALLAFSLTGALVGFLWYNFSPASIFMGDTGSMLVGFILAFLAVKFVEVNVSHEASGFLTNTAPVFAVAVLIVPLYDTLRVFIIRFMKGKSPFEPGREHVHHQFLGMGMNHRGVALTLYAINLAFILFVMIFPRMEVNTLLALTLGSTLLVFPTQFLKRRVLRLFGYRVAPKRNDNGVRLVKRQPAELNFWVPAFEKGQDSHENGKGRGNKRNDEKEDKSLVS